MLFAVAVGGGHTSLGFATDAAAATAAIDEAGSVVLAAAVVDDRQHYSSSNMRLSRIGEIKQQRYNYSKRNATAV